MLKEETQRKRTSKAVVQEISSEGNLLEYFRKLF